MLGASRCGLLRLTKRKQTNYDGLAETSAGRVRGGYEVRRFNRDKAQLVSPVFGGLFQGRRRMCVWPAEGEMLLEGQ
ncbi:hypothetical protein ILYODFUR_026349 [Ilyodon furcidens]|uniref:Uncharacterized protein n=1 Tax=Ilyodon furcidens TaxID=33524 RepID=A0ABV0UVD4_9TELE